MKNKLPIFLTAAALLSACASAEKTPEIRKPVLAADILDPDEYVLDERFSDEFESDKLDSEKWFDFYPTWTGREGVFHFSRNNVSVEDGKLALTAKIPDESEVPPEMKAEGKQGYSTAEVRSKTRVLYGYFELKFKTMNATVCNAFWLNDPVDPPKKYKPGDKTEEIDIFEIFGKNTDPKYKVAGHYFMTTHVADTPYVESKVWLGRKVSGEKPVVPEKFAEGYNVAGLLWTPEKLVWTLNGRVMREIKNEDFHRPLYLNMDCEIMKYWGGLPSPDDLPAKFKIEYVRVWRKKPDSKK